MQDQSFVDFSPLSSLNTKHSAREFLANKKANFESQFFLTWSMELTYKNVWNFQNCEKFLLVKLQLSELQLLLRSDRSVPQVYDIISFWEKKDNRNWLKCQSFDDDLKRQENFDKVLSCSLLINITHDLLISPPGSFNFSGSYGIQTTFLFAH